MWSAISLDRSTDRFADPPTVPTSYTSISPDSRKLADLIDRSVQHVPTSERLGVAITYVSSLESSRQLAPSSLVDVAYLQLVDIEI